MLINIINTTELILPCCQNGKPKNKVTVRVKGHHVHLIMVSFIGNFGSIFVSRSNLQRTSNSLNEGLPIKMTRIKVSKKSIVFPSKR